MKHSSPLTVCLGIMVGFIGCCVLGRLAAHKNIYRKFLRLDRFREQETSYFPTASQMIAVVRAQCPPESSKVLVVIGGNSVFNGSHQKHDELWSSALQTELGDQYRVVNFAMPGAGVMDNGGVIFEALAREYPRALLVTNTEPGYYAAANQSSYSYLFWDAYYKGLLPAGAQRTAESAQQNETSDRRELELGRRMDGLFYFNDLWNYVAYRYVSTVWTSWLKGRSFQARNQLSDWYDKRPRISSDESAFEKLLPGHLAALRNRRPLLADRFQRVADGALVQTPESLHEDEQHIAALLPEPLERRSLIVFTPYNPWFLAHLTEEEQTRVDVSYRNGTDLLRKAGFHVLSLIHAGFEPSDFGDTVHLVPAGGRRLAHLVADSIRSLSAEPQTAELR